MKFPLLFSPILSFFLFFIFFVELNNNVSDICYLLLGTSATYKLVSSGFYWFMTQCVPLDHKPENMLV